MKFEETTWHRMLQKYKKVMVFGAKGMAIATRELIRRSIADIFCYVVSVRGENPDAIDGIPVRTFDEISAEDKAEALIVISHRSLKAAEMRNVLENAGFRNIAIGGHYYWNRFESDQYMPALQAYMGYLPSDAKEGVAEETSHSLCIYSVTSHKNLHRVEAQEDARAYIARIQAGAALTQERIAEVTDAMGVNISSENGQFCECSAGYWIANNDTMHAYVGLFHYARELDVEKRHLNYLMNAGYDAILPYPFFSEYGIEMKDAWVAEKIPAIRNAICACGDTKMNAAFEAYASGAFYFPCNIVIAKREVFAEYYRWLMLVLRKIEADKKVAGIELQPRELGYHAEFLTGVYFYSMRQQLKLAMADLKYIGGWK